MALIRPMKTKCLSARKKLLTELNKKTTPDKRKKVLKQAIYDLDEVLAAMTAALKNHTVC